MLSLKKYLYRISVGIKNKIRYGIYGPDFGELIYINPQNHSTSIPFKHRSFSGTILSGDWDLQPQSDIESTIIFLACKQRWIHDTPWADTGIYDFMIDKIEKFGGHVDGCSNLKDIILRYKKLDLLFAEVKRTRKFKTQKELDKSSFNENGGLLFHIDRNNKPIYGGGGMHRFAMAKILKLDLIPAQLGVVHSKATKSWKTHKKNTNQNIY